MNFIKYHLIIIALLITSGLSAQLPFITTWQTDNAGTSNNDEITIPTSGGGYNYDIYWEEDGNPGNNGTVLGLTGNHTITFPSAGTYIVEIDGDFPRIFFSNGGDRLKILSVEQWGDIAWSSFNQAFYGAANLEINAADAPDLSSVTDMFRAFSDASSMNSDLSAWDVSNVTDMRRALLNTSSFNQSLAAWDISNATTMIAMLNNSDIDVANYDATLTAWSALTVQSGVSLGANGLNYCSSDADRQSLIDDDGWTISGDSKLCPITNPFITTWQTDNVGSSNNDQITIPTSGAGYNYDIYWEEDGNPGNNGTVSGLTGNHTITFPSAGTYIVEITGVFPRIYFNNGGDRLKILSVEDWGNGEWTSFNAAFYGAENLEINAGNAPDLSLVTNMFRMFSDATSVNSDLSAWDVSTIIDMRRTFLNATSFNQSLAAWDISNVTNMTAMLNSTAINQSNYDATLTAWAGLTVQSGVILDAIGLLYCSSETDRQSLIDDDGWVISGDSKLCAITNPFITTWQTNNAGSSNNDQITIPTTGGSYNYDIYWEEDGNPGNNGTATGITGNHTITFPSAGTYILEITGLFPRIYFNNGGDRLKILSVEDWGDGEWNSFNSAFFGASNLEINAGNSPGLASVTDMFSAFNGASSMNSDLSAWDVGTIVDMRQTFLNASSFNQSLAAWDISNVTQMNSMLNGTDLSLDNYDATLIGWQGQVVQPNVSLGASGLIYCASENQRQSLIDDEGWTISGDSRFCGFTNPFVTTWQSDNAGTSNNDQVTIPTGGGSYDYDIYWEDENDPLTNGTISGLTGSHTITFPAAGTYRVEISGVFSEFSLNNGGDKDKLLSIESWGDGNWTSMNNAFYGAGNMQINAVDSPNLELTTNLSGMFRDATSFNQNFNSWDTETITDMSDMFNGASSYNFSLGDWDISSVTDMSGMLDNSGMQCENYGLSMFGWVDKPGTPSGVTLGGLNMEYATDASRYRDTLITDFGWTINGDAIDSSCTLVLPVVLISYEAHEIENNTIKISWKTGSEINNDYFTLEHSTNGVDFKIFKTVKGSGNSNSEKEYSVLHKNPPSGNNYYRLKQTDIDRRQEQLGIRLVNLQGKPGIKIYPNPVQPNQAFFVSTGIEGNFNLEILELSGKLIYEESFNYNSGEISINQSISKGTYLVRISTNHSVYFEKLLVY